jgi:hypothetical protein
MGLATVEPALSQYRHEMHVMMERIDLMAVDR